MVLFLFKEIDDDGLIFYVVDLECCVWVVGLVVWYVWLCQVVFVDKWVVLVFLVYLIKYVCIGNVVGLDILVSVVVLL